jgi:hypothetical protein
MARNYYDRYQAFRLENSVKSLPFIKLNERSTDRRERIKKNSRLDIISNNVYGSPYYGWLILQANPQYGGLESDIPIGSIIRVPFPFRAILQELEEKISRFDSLYGI